jgi:hypothetical protein
MKRFLRKLSKDTVVFVLFYSYAVLIFDFSFRIKSNFSSDLQSFLSVISVDYLQKLLKFGYE